MGSLPHHSEPIYNDGGALPPLAIIGMSFRFPQDATDASQFWNMMAEKRCASTEVPPDRFNVNSHHHLDRNRLETTSVRNGHFITGDLAAWDAPFFNITAAEAESMDPAQRITLEAAFRALENAGLPLETVAGTKTSVYSATFMHDYENMQNNDPDTQSKYRGTGTSPNMLSNRVSWFFDLRGPSGSVDTACSSSLLAVDLVCQSIWSGDANMGLACGNNLMMTPYTTISLDNLGLLGKDGRCYSFDHRANGYARGEGVGVIVIKPLAAALQDGDSIRAVIRSTCSNQDGKTPAISQPSREAQLVLIQDAYKKAGLDMGFTRYFEAHGTGTPVGDPIETGSIGAAFRKFRSPTDPLYVGSVKSNIGHLEGAAGVAGVIKAVLALEAGVIPPQSNFEKLNSAIDTEFLNIQIPSDAVPWPTHGLRRASIQSFGIGGANSHVVLDDAYNFLRQHGLAGNHNTIPVPPRNLNYLSEVLVGSSWLDKPNQSISNGSAYKNGAHVNGAPKNHIVNLNNELSANGVTTSSGSNEDGEAQLLVWSTADESGMGRVTAAWKDYIDQLQLPSHVMAKYIQNLAYTLASRRTHFPYRSFAVVNSATDFGGVIGQISKQVRANAAPKLGFVFSGQGSQWYAMGRELFYRYPIYQNSLLDASTYLNGLGCQWDAVEELMRDETFTNVNDAEYSQPLCTIVQVALVELLESFGIRPANVVGHSSGEIAAAYAAGALSKYAAWKIAYFRGLLASKLTASTNAKMKGAMMAVGLSAEDAKEYLDQVATDLGKQRLVVACVNSPVNVTISGELTHIDYLKTLLDAAPGNIFARKLKVGVAYHSFQMQEVADEYLKLIGELSVPSTPKSRHLPTMLSSVTGTWVERADLAKAEYWVRNLVSPVLFSQALATMCAAAGSPNSRRKLDNSHTRNVALNELVEIGPHSVMQGPSREILRSIGKEGIVRYLPALVRKQSAVRTVLDVAARLHCFGHQIKLEAVNSSTSDSPVAQKSLVTLPEYPFNHSKSYWSESRTSKTYRFRPFNRHDLVGAHAFDWNPLEARWRHFIRISDMPWVEHHKISGTTLYPASGMLVMAIEAARQLADPEKELTGFNFHNVAFHSALNIPDSQTVEVNLHMRPRRDMHEKDAGWYDFRLYKHDPTVKNLIGGDWRENCNGSIQLVYADKSADDANDELDSDNEERLWKERRLNRFSEVKSRCTQKTEPNELYELLASSGYGYGPAFRAITDIAHDGADSTVATVQTYKWARHFEGPDPGSEHIVHPTTLDTILHTMIAVYTSGGAKEIATTIPTFVDRIWISAKGGLSAPDADAVTVQTTGSSSGLRVSESSLVVLNSEGTELLIDIENFQTTAVAADGEADADDQQQAAKPTYTVDWKPDPSLLSPAQLQLYCEEFAAGLSQEPAEMQAKLDVLILATIKRTLRALEEKSHSEEVVNQPYYAWMKDQIENLDAQKQALLDDDAFISSLVKQLPSDNKQVQLYSSITQNHLELFVDTAKATEFFFDKTPLEDATSEAVGAPSSNQLYALVDAMAHKNPTLRLIELGGGSGFITDQLLKILTTRESGAETSVVPRYSRYDFTDSSPDSVLAAKEKYRDQGTRFQAGALDAENLQSGSYDAVVISTAKQTKSDLQAALKSSRELVKSDGKVFIFHSTPRDGSFRKNFAYGLLESWWSSSDSNPWLDESEWKALLEETGYSRDYVIFNDCQDSSFHEIGIIVGTPAEKDLDVSITKPGAQVQIIHGGDAEQYALAERVQQSFHGASSQSAFSSVSVVSIFDALDISLEDDTLLVFLLELGKPVWLQIDELHFTALQKLLTTNLATKALWVGQEGSSDATSADAPPAYRLIDGLGRVLNSEVDGEVMTLLTLQTQAGITDKHVELITDVAKLVQGAEEESNDTEFHEKNGRLCVPRMVQSASLSEAIAERVAFRQNIHRKWQDDSGVPLKLSLGTPGLLNTLRFIQDKDHDDSTPLGPGEAEIEVRAVGLNYRDILIALGRLQNANIGCECAGIVRRVGPDVEGIAVGDRVAALAPSGCYRTYLRVDHRFTARLPDAMPFDIAAAMLINHLTAWSALHDIGRVAPGETVLVHSAAGGTGQAALQVSRHLGAKVIATAGTADKKALITKEYGVDPDRIFSSRNPAAFSRGVQRVTNGQGVDVVLNALSGESLNATWDCVGPYGRFIEIGKRDIRARKNLPMSKFEENVSFHAFDVGIVCKFKPHTIRPTLAKLFALYEQGVLAPASPLQVYGVSELERAFRTMQGGRTMGKIVIEMRPDDEVKAIVDTQPTTGLGPDATYVVAGGLGGLGRSMSGWLVDRGARNLILLSRSGAKNQQAKDFVEQLIQRGVNVVTPRCDVSDAVALEKVLDEYRETMPPVRGAIQATMVLRDAAFAGMSYETWQAATAPKVQGSWNMHKLLPPDMDFFIGLASAAGVAGGRGQANYAAGNTFIDALMRHRVANGQNGATLDLGVFFEVGFMTESSDLQSRWQGREVAAVTERDLFSLLDCYCTTSAKKPQIPFQAALGITGFVGDKSSQVYFRKPMLRALALEGDDSSAENADDQTSQNVDFALVFTKAASHAEAAASVNEALLRKLASTLSLSREELDANTPLAAYGVDSLVAVELRNWFSKKVHADLAIFDILGSATTTTASALAVSKSRLKKGDWAEAVVGE